MFCTAIKTQNLGMDFVKNTKKIFKHIEKENSHSYFWH